MAFENDSFGIRKTFEQSSSQIRSQLQILVFDFMRAIIY